MILTTVLLFFITLELSNVIVLLFVPDTKKANGIGIFNQWTQSKQDENLHLFIRYLVNWVAGVKLIFIILIVIIAFMGSDIIKMYALGGLILSISFYYFKLLPIIKKLDEKEQITPKGYSKTLTIIITSFIFVFTTVLVCYLVL